MKSIPVAYIFSIQYYIPYRGINMPKGIPRNPSVKQHVLHRLAIASGHLDRVITMIKDGEYCIDVINQSRAVQSALKTADNVLLKNHLETCVAAEIKKGNTKEIIKEVIEIMDKQTTDKKCCCDPCTCKDCTCDCHDKQNTSCQCTCHDEKHEHCTCGKK
jgi:DNA-binding FrmR family transcriptional regulator